jgi:hypothetical protein
MGEDDIGFHEPASGFDIILIEFELQISATCRKFIPLSPTLSAF